MSILYHQDNELAQGLHSLPWAEVLVPKPVPPCRSWCMPIHRGHADPSGVRLDAMPRRCWVIGGGERWRWGTAWCVTSSMVFHEKWTFGLSDIPNPVSRHKALDVQPYLGRTTERVASNQKGISNPIDGYSSKLNFIWKTNSHPSSHSLTHTHTRTTSSKSNNSTHPKPVRTATPNKHM